MDGIHDLGGREGFGPIPIGDDTPFAHEWERRMWALSRHGIAPEGATIDWFRHVLERMVPKDYLSFPYFAKWCTTFLAMHLDAGSFTLEEIRAGHTRRRRPPPPPLSLDEVLARQRAMHRDFSAPAAAPPRFAAGDRVRTRRNMPGGHTRLPLYARGRQGQVLVHRGAHLLADAGARGGERGEHLYTVVFGAPELWGEGADPRDSVTLDLWESYLVPA